MPGKVNPVLPEATLMVCAQVIGNDAAVAAAGASGSFELNVMMPVIGPQPAGVDPAARAASTRLLADRCVDGITADAERMRRYAESSPSVVTPLNKYVGYETAAKIAKQALAEGATIRETVLELGSWSAASSPRSSWTRPSTWSRMTPPVRTRLTNRARQRRDLDRTQAGQAERPASADGSRTRGGRGPKSSSRCRPALLRASPGGSAVRCARRTRRTDRSSVKTTHRGQPPRGRRRRQTDQNLSSRRLVADRFWEPPGPQHLDRGLRRRAPGAQREAGRCVTVARGGRGHVADRRPRPTAPALVDPAQRDGEATCAGSFEGVQRETSCRGRPPRARPSAA